MKYKDSNGEWQTIKFKNYGIEQTPIGSMIYYPSQSIPKGYLVCDGSTYLIADYPLLFNAIGYIGGEDVDTGYFRVPDMRGNVPAGYYEGLTSSPLAGEFGDKVGKPTHTLTIAELPRHKHNVVGNYAGTTGDRNTVLAQLINKQPDWADNNLDDDYQYTGGNQAHSIVQPTMLYHWLIKAKNIVTLGGYTEDFEVTGDLNILGDITHNGSHIIESGSNANGSWTKWSDGTMICKKTISGTVDITSSTMGGAFYYGEVSLGDFPMNFIERPTITVSPQTQTGTQYFLAGSPGGGYGSATSWGIYSLLRPATREAVAYVLDAIAVGKWK